MNRSLLLRITLILFFLVLICFILSSLKGLLIPLSLAALFAILLTPIVSWMEGIHVPRVLAILIVLILMLAVLGTLIYLLVMQINVFVNDVPELTKQINDKLSNIQQFIQSKTHMQPEAQISWLKEKITSLLNSSGSFITSTITSTTSTVVDFFLMLVYIFFMIFYRHRFNVFILKITPEGNHYKVQQLIDQIRKVVQHYLGGVFIVVAILAVLDVSALEILQIPYAFFLGILAALLNVIPYVGVLIGNLLATLVAFLTKDSLWYPVIVLAVFWGIQMLENSVLTPKITGSSVKLNPFITIVALLFGGFLWGIAGMVLSIPFTGMLKVVLDNIKPLRPYGYLLGDKEGGDDIITPKNDELFFSLIKRKKKKE